MVIAASLVLAGTAVAASCSNPGGQNVTRSDGTTYPYFGMPCSSSGISLSNILFFFFFFVIGFLFHLPVYNRGQPLRLHWFVALPLFHPLLPPCSFSLYAVYPCSRISTPRPGQCMRRLLPGYDLHLQSRLLHSKPWSSRLRLLAELVRCHSHGTTNFS